MEKLTRGRTSFIIAHRLNTIANADEIFISGNYSKVMPVLRIDSRELQPGPFYRRARELYWAFAHDKGLGKAA